MIKILYLSVINFATYMKQFFSLLKFLPVFFSLGLFAQEPQLKYIDAREFPLYGQAETVDPETYFRIDSKEVGKLPPTVQRLSKSTAGFHVDFKTNSTELHLKWILEEYKEMWNLTPLAVNGFDLYAWNQSQWQFVAAARPSADTNSVRMIRNLDGQMRNYRLYFPLYPTGVEKVQLGVEASAEILPPDEHLSPVKKIVIYGSSITQGASASRPGMAFPSILSRDLNMEFINLGFSGSGKMEIEMADILGRLQPELFILDCVPNPSVDQIKQRAIPFIKKLREAQPGIPILILESIYRENAHWDSVLHDKVTGQNNAIRKAYESLMAEGYENIYYLPSDGFLGNDHEATIDGAHLSDLGHLRLAEAVLPTIVKILEKE